MSALFVTFHLSQCVLSLQFWRCAILVEPVLTALFCLYFSHSPVSLRRRIASWLVFLPSVESDTALEPFSGLGPVVNRFAMAQPECVWQSPLRRQRDVFPGDANCGVRPGEAESSLVYIRHRRCRRWPTPSTRRLRRRLLHRAD